MAIILFLRWIIISQDNDTLCISVYCSPGMFSISQSGFRITNHWPIRVADGPDFNLFIGPSLWILNPRHYTDVECWQHQLANGCRPLMMIKHQDNPAFFHLTMLLMQFFSLVSYLLTINDEVSDFILMPRWEGTLLSWLTSCVHFWFYQEMLFVKQVWFHKRTVFPRIGVNYSMR